MTKRRQYKTKRGFMSAKLRYIAAARAGRKSGRHRTGCKKVTRSYCFTTRGKPVSCKGAIGKQYRRPVRATFYLCYDKTTGRFAYNDLCSCTRRKKK
jgi:hypothetical protein